MKKLLLYIFTLMISFNSFAQKKLLKEVDERKIIQLASDSLTIEASVKSFDIKPKPKRRYFWYWKGALKSNIGDFHGILQHGTFVKYDLDKNLIEKANFKKGLVKGKYFYWNTNGDYAKVEKWKKGMLNGKYKIYKEDGTLEEEGRMKNNLKHGKVIIYLRDGKPEITKYKKGLAKTKNPDKVEKKEQKLLKKAKKKAEENSKNKTKGKEKRKKKEKENKPEKEKTPKPKKNKK